MTGRPSTDAAPGARPLGTTEPPDDAPIRERGFDPERDLPALAALICDVNAHDRFDWFPTPASLAVEWMAKPGFDPRHDARLLEASGRLVGAISVGWRDRGGRVVHRIDSWVHPDVRRRGHGGRLLAWAEARARASVADGSGGPRDLPHFLGGGADVANAASIAFAIAAGYQPIRYSFEMRRPLDLPIPDAPLPAGLEVLPVEPEQHRRIWDADVEAFRDHWESGVRDEADFVQHFRNPDLDTSLWQVAWDGDEVAGSVMNGIYADENAKLGLAIGWLDHVSVRRPWRGRGLAGALIVRSLTVLRDRGMTVATLGVDAENPTGALGLYERLGFRRHKTWQSYRKPL
jgi:mycothiol synthase